MQPVLFRRWAALALTLPFILLGCASHPPRRPVPVVNIPADVAAEFKQSVAGWNAGNLNAFLSIYADNATLATPDGFVQGRQALRDFYLPNFRFGAVRVQLALEQLEVEVLSPDAVLVRAIYTNSLNGQITRRGPSTLVLRQILGRWQIIHDHSS